MKERRKPVEERGKIIVDGVPQRLLWIAENHPEILMKKILGGEDQYWSSLYKAGYTREEAFKKCKSWGLDAGILGYVEY